jgi:hypothetical protein
MMEMSGRCLPRLTRMLGMSKYQESEPHAGQTLFIDAPKGIEPLGSHCSSSRGDRTRRSIVTRHTPPASSRRITAMCHIL